jgi:hypothetical protein
MEQENQEQDGEMKQEFQSYRDEIKNKVGLSNVRCTPRGVACGGGVGGVWHPPSFSEIVGKTRSHSVMARAMTAVGKTNRLKWNFAPR